MRQTVVIAEKSKRAGEEILKFIVNNKVIEIKYITQICSSNYYA